MVDILIETGLEIDYRRRHDYIEKGVHAASAIKASRSAQG